jgi:hypothetical protein
MPQPSVLTLDFLESISETHRAITDLLHRRFHAIWHGSTDIGAVELKVSRISAHPSLLQHRTLVTWAQCSQSQWR